MKTLLASLLALFAAGATPLPAETAAQMPENCPLTGATGSTPAKCQALRADNTEKVQTCLALRRVAAEERIGRSSVVNGHSARASYMACASEVRMTLGLAAK